MDPDALTNQIACVLAAREHDLGMTGEQAYALADAIADADRTDDDAFRAHDLLWMRATYGRAW